MGLPQCHAEAPGEPFLVESRAGDAASTGKGEA